MKKLMEFFNYLVGAVALIGLAGGITYGVYTSSGIVFGSLTGVLCLGLLLVIVLGLSGKFREEGEQGFPPALAGILVLGSGLLAVLIAIGAGASSLKENEVSHSPVPVATSSAPSEVSTPIPSAAAPSEPSSTVEQPASTTPLTADDFGIPPQLVALLIALAVLAILIWVGYMLKQGGNANLFW